MKKESTLYQTYTSKYKPKLSIQQMILFSFSLIAALIACAVAITAYTRFEKRMQSMKMDSAEQLLGQTAGNFEEYLRNMRNISDTMYYSVIKDKDLAADTLDVEMNLFYEANKDKVVSIACYTLDGELVAAAPVNILWQGADITQQSWFTQAVDRMENLHFSTPHVENIFEDDTSRYNWVVSISRGVELTQNKNSEMGVLLVDMNYGKIEQLLEKNNMDTANQYVYLTDSEGDLIYHPRQDLIYSGLFNENNLAAAQYDDGSVEETFDGERRIVTVKTVSYTGWKIVSVIPIKAFEKGLIGTKYFMIMVIAIAILAVLILNQIVSSYIASPLVKLHDSVKSWEAGNMNPDIYVDGPAEVAYLGRTLRSTVQQIRQLMDDVLKEQEEKSKSELDALQSQINPHFLYNTLDSIVWMIEGEKYDDAVFMITQLARLFRISLSRGRTVITIEEEVRHACHYMNIQKIRYKNNFTFSCDVDPAIYACKTVKLIIQPLLENAIYYGVNGMDGEGEIALKAYRDEDDIYIEVTDNGLGMKEEDIEGLLTDHQRKPSRGSGVGLINVHRRIGLYFGEAYGLEIFSAPDEGMTVRIHLPYELVETKEEENHE